MFRIPSFALRVYLQMALRDYRLYKFLSDALVRKAAYPNDTHYGTYRYDPYIFKWCRKIFDPDYNRISPTNDDYLRNFINGLNKHDPKLMVYLDPNTQIYESDAIYEQFNREAIEEQRIYQNTHGDTAPHEAIHGGHGLRLPDLPQSGSIGEIRFPHEGLPDKKTGELITAQKHTPIGVRDLELPNTVKRSDFKTGRGATEAPELTTPQSHQPIGRNDLELPNTVKSVGPGKSGLILPQSHTPIKIKDLKLPNTVNLRRGFFGRFKVPYGVKNTALNLKTFGLTKAKVFISRFSIPLAMGSVLGGFGLMSGGGLTGAAGGFGAGFLTGSLLKNKSINETIGGFLRGGGGDRLRYLSRNRRRWAVFNIFSSTGGGAGGGSIFGAVASAAAAGPMLIIGGLLVGGLAIYLTFFGPSVKFPGDGSGTAEAVRDGSVKIQKIGPGKVGNGENITYQITASHTSSTAADITITDRLPEGVSFVSADNEGRESGGVVTWILRQTPPTTAKTVTLVLKARDDIWVSNFAEATILARSEAEGVRPPVAGGDESPNKETCQGKYGLNNPIGNFGDPLCNYSKDDVYELIKQQDPKDADYWFYTVVRCESGFNPNAYADPIRVGTPDSAGAWGLYQMGRGRNGELDHGDVPWQKQTSNAISYNKNLKKNGLAWRYWQCAKDRW